MLQRGSGHAGWQGGFSTCAPVPKGSGGIAEGVAPLLSERLLGDSGQSGCRVGAGVIPKVGRRKVGRRLNCCAGKAGPVGPPGVRKSESCRLMPGGPGPHSGKSVSPCQPQAADSHSRGLWGPESASCAWVSPGVPLGSRLHRGPKPPLLSSCYLILCSLASSGRRLSGAQGGVGGPWTARGWRHIPAGPGRPSQHAI